MKTLKRLSSILLAVFMVMAMAIPAFADDTTETGTITIDNAIQGQKYTIYKILDLESYNATSNAYSYKAASAWKEFINSSTIKDVYVNVDAQGYVTWKDGAKEADFAKEAQKYAVDNGISNQGLQTAETTTVTFTELSLGYYLVDTSLGALCSLDTTNPSATIKEKNEVPTVEKEVKEDSTNTFGVSNTAQIGDTVEFKTTIRAKKGAQNYVLHDELSAGLTLNTSSIQVKVNDKALDSANYTVESANLKDNCDFHITFTNDYLATITGNTDIVVTYNATLNEDAVISTESNTNETWLNYGDSSKTSKDKTDTYTFMFDLVKTDENDTILTGAKFELYDASTGDKKINLVKETNADGSSYYRVATSAEASAEDFESAVIEAGNVTIKGLDSNTSYWLEETKAPDGYNQLAARHEVKIGTSNLTATVENNKWKSGGVHVVNKTGAELPSTGGMGTTIFYIAGTVLVLGAGVILVTRRRMSR